MSCNGCAKKFTIFKSEHACPKCGFGYCNSCLEHPLFIDKISKTAKVCTKCKIANDNGTSQGQTPIEPPKAYLKRIENMLEDTKPPIVVYKTGDRFERLKRGLSQEDKAIVERLEKLKDRKGDEPLPTDEQIKERLSKLRNEPTSIAKKSSLPAVDVRSNQQKCDDLLMQYLEECEMEEKKGNADKDLEERLNKLKGLPAGVSNIPKDTSMEDLTEGEMAARLIKQIISEPDGIEDDPLTDKSESIKTSEDEDLSSEENNSSSDEDNTKKKSKK